MWSSNAIPDQSGRIAIVTGANSGIGRQTTRALARAGAHVIMACRSLKRGDGTRTAILAELPWASIEVMELDLADLESVRTFAAAIISRQTPIVLLINNAGVYRVPRWESTKQGFELQFGVNHLGHFALTGLVLPAMINTPGSRIVTESSIVHHLSRGVPYDNLSGSGNYRVGTAYNGSKLANLLFTVELERRLRRAGAATISVGAHPGIANTNLHAAGPSIGGMTLGGRLLSLATLVIAQPESAGALSQLYAATAPDVAGGRYFGPSGPLELWGSDVKPARISRRAKNLAAATKLWSLSEEMSGVSYL